MILDRDGVINSKAEEGKIGQYILEPRQLNLFPDFFELAFWADQSGIDLVVATNQQGLATGKLTEAKLNQIHKKIQESLIARGIAPIKKFYVCGHLDNTCSCRKPKPGLLYRIVEDYGLGPENFLFIGDSLSDKLAAGAAKMKFIQVRRISSEPIFAEVLVEDLSQIVEGVK